MVVLHEVGRKPERLELVGPERFHEEAAGILEDVRLQDDDSVQRSLDDVELHAPPLDSLAASVPRGEVHSKGGARENTSQIRWFMILVPVSRRLVSNEILTKPCQK